MDNTIDYETNIIDMFNKSFKNLLNNIDKYKGTEHKLLGKKLLIINNNIKDITDMVNNLSDELRTDSLTKSLDDNFIDIFKNYFPFMMLEYLALDKQNINR